MRSIDLSKCPPILKQLIEQQGSATQAAKAIKSSVYTINRMARGILPMSDKMAEKIAAGANGAASTKTPEPEVTIPPWNGKVAPYSYTRMKDRKKITIKTMPVEFAQLIKRERGVLNNAAKAAGVSSWSSARAMIEGGKYDAKLHDNAYRALNGLPLPTKTNGASHGEDNDAYSLGVALCLVSLTEFERLEDLAEIMGGKLVRKFTAGTTGWWAIYKIADRKKLETFKRLAQRDAKKIVCP